MIELVAPEASLDAEVDRWFANHIAPQSAAALRYAAAAARLPLVAQVRRTLPELERLYLDGLMRTTMPQKASQHFRKSGRRGGPTDNMRD